MRFAKWLLTAATATALLTGCSVDRWVYRPDINQGNYVTAQEVEQLQVGQTKQQVLYIMGTPMLSSVFGDNTWYYVFREQPQHQAVRQQTYRITFDHNDLVSSIDKLPFDPKKQ